MEEKKVQCDSSEDFKAKVNSELAEIMKNENFIITASTDDGSKMIVTGTYSIMDLSVHISVLLKKLKKDNIAAFYSTLLTNIE